METLMSHDRIVELALAITASRLRESTYSVSNPEKAKQYLLLRQSSLEHEEFGIIYIDAQSRVIECEVLFRGTITQTSVYPREVVKAVLKFNAQSVIFFHNHPSGEPTPSSADKELTERLKTALAIIDVRVLDHIVIAGREAKTFTELGLI